MIELAVFLKANGYRPRQVQDFIPAPMDVATGMWHTGLDPFTLRPVAAARRPARPAGPARAHAVLRPPELVRGPPGAPRRGRGDLIGEGPRCLIPARPPPEALAARRRAAERGHARARRGRRHRADRRLPPRPRRRPPPEGAVARGAGRPFAPGSPCRDRDPRDRATPPGPRRQGNSSLPTSPGQLTWRRSSGPTSPRPGRRPSWTSGRYGSCRAWSPIHRPRASPGGGRGTSGPGGVRGVRGGSGGGGAAWGGPPPARDRGCGGGGTVWPGGRSWASPASGGRPTGGGRSEIGVLARPRRLAARVRDRGRPRARERGLRRGSGAADRRPREARPPPFDRPARAPGLPPRRRRRGPGRGDRPPLRAPSTRVSRPSPGIPIPGETVAVRSPGGRAPCRGASSAATTGIRSRRDRPPLSPDGGPG